MCLRSFLAVLMDKALHIGFRDAQLPRLLSAVILKLVTLALVEITAHGILEEAADGAALAGGELFGFPKRGCRQSKGGAHRTVPPRLFAV
jgi:hypothetical protein